MPQIINTNTLSLLAQNNLNTSQSSLNTAIQRLSSGLRINSAKDDAAGQAIANRFTSNIRGLTQAQRNANDGISVAQTTEGALKEVNNNLQRIRELTVQAANGTNSQSDLQSIQDEIKARLTEINRVSSQTQFNGVKVLASTQSMNIQVGANDNETIGISLQQIDTGTLGVSTFSVNGPEAVGATSFGGTTSAATANYVSAPALQAAYGATTSITLSAITEKSAGTLATKLGVASTSVAFTTQAIYDNSGNWYAEVKISAASASEAAALNNEGFAGFTSLSAQFFYVAIDPQSASFPGADKAAISVDSSKVSVSDLLNGKTASALSVVDAALSTVDRLRSSLGAAQNRFDSVIANLGTTVINLSTSRSRIEDSDYAVEVSNMTRAQILQQAGTSVLAQANQATQSVLSLLR